ncbi:MAG: protein-L-isoaspartate(D-aspartate) O-methyltransferase [Candidatus Pacearchaeota archaeon]|nr:protein-L-isoaspartate(D-aspartate) O-methyltransferase [Candidatus Pacearchaeota archaeon]
MSYKMDKEDLIKSLEEKKFSKEIVDAFSKVNREDFLPYSLKKKAYDDTALPIGNGQTISQPYTIALMLSELDLKKGQKILEIGSGSGYVLALIAEIIGETGKIFGLEVIPALVKKSKENLENYRNVKIYKKNGSNGFPDEARFDRILVSAALREVPERLMEQLKHKGILVAPQGSRFEQEIIVIQRKTEAEFDMKKRLPGFVFVPFVEEN